MELVIGDKNLSSWSLRPWLVLKRTGAPFTERLVRLNRPETADEIAAVSPSGRVPVLIDGDLVVWDSLAVCVHLAERHPDVRMWPQDPAARSRARSAVCEMHAGFASLRGECPMNLALRTNASVSPATKADLRRLVALWGEMRARHGGEGPWLFGAWSIADAFFTPVATRVRTYGLSLADEGDDGTAAAYVATLLADPHFLEWEAAALAEAG